MTATNGSFAARAEILLNRLAQVEAQETDRQAQAEIERARLRVSKDRGDLADALRVIQILEESGINPPVIPNGTLADLSKARTALRTAATTMVGAHIGDVVSRIRTQSVNNALMTVEKFTMSLVTGLNRSVDRERLRILPHGIDERIVVYPGVSEAMAVRLRRIQSLLQRKVERLEPDDLVKRFREIVNGVASWTEDRPKMDEKLEDQHPEVSEFLREAATEEGAPWLLITSAVRTWLSDPENTVNLRVVLRS